MLNAKESEAYLALAFQGAAWTDEYAFPLMIMQTIMGGWDRSSGASKRVSTLSYLAFRVSRHNQAHNTRNTDRWLEAMNDPREVL